MNSYRAGAEILAVIVMLAMSLLAARRIPAGTRVPMQWGLDGKPTWFAPRIVGLLVIPVVATLLNVAFVAADYQGESQYVHPAPNGLKLCIAIGLLAMHAVYLRAISRSGG